MEQLSIIEQEGIPLTSEELSEEELFVKEDSSENEDFPLLFLTEKTNK